MSCCGRRGFVRAAQQFFLRDSSLHQAITSSQYDRCRASAAREARARRVRRSDFRLLVDAPVPARAALGAAEAQRATGTRSCRSWLQIEERRREGGQGSYERMLGGRSSLRTSIESRSAHAQLMLPSLGDALHERRRGIERGRARRTSASAPPVEHRRRATCPSPTTSSCARNERDDQRLPFGQGRRELKVLGVRTHLSRSGPHAALPPAAALAAPAAPCSSPPTAAAAAGPGAGAGEAAAGGGSTGGLGAT